MVIVIGYEFLPNPWHLGPTYLNPWKFSWQNMWYVFEMCVRVNISLYFTNLFSRF